MQDFSLPSCGDIPRLKRDVSRTALPAAALRSLALPLAFALSRLPEKCCRLSASRFLREVRSSGLSLPREFDTHRNLGIASEHLIPPSHSRARRPCHDGFVAWPSRPWEVGAAKKIVAT